MQYVWIFHVWLFCSYEFHLCCFMALSSLPSLYLSILLLMATRFFSLGPLTVALWGVVLCVSLEHNVCFAVGHVPRCEIAGAWGPTTVSFRWCCHKVSKVSGANLHSHQLGSSEPQASCPCSIILSRVGLFSFYLLVGFAFPWQPMILCMLHACSAWSILSPTFSWVAHLISIDL